MEDATGNKTYTFKIERNNSSFGFLENLILKETGASEYSAYIVKYDQMAVENLGSIAQSDLKNHITFTPLGTKTGAEVFGKYNTDPCQVMMPVSSNWVQVGGTMCYTGEHDFAHISECNYKSNINGYPPTPGYSTYEVSYGSMDICGGGGGFTPGNNGNTGGGTTPIGGGGGGWNGTFIDVTDPCYILKNNLQLAKQSINRTDVQNQNTTMTQTIVTDTIEKAFYFGKDLANNNKISPILGGTSNSVTLNLSNAPFLPHAVVHNHNGTVDTGYTNFSSADINSLNYYVHQASTTQYLYANGYDGSMYVMTIQDMDAFDQFVENYPWSSIDVISPSNPNGTGDWKKDLDIYNDEIITYERFQNQGKPDNEAYDLTMGYLANKYNMGIVISKKGTDGNFHPIQAESFETIDPITGEIKTNFKQINPCNL